MDQLVLELTQASLWVQVPVLLAVLMPLAGIGALLLIRGIDWLARLAGSFVRQNPAQAVR